MRLLHYHSEPIEFDREWAYDLSKSRVGKPDGLWVSVEGEGDWESWCKDEEFALYNLAAVHEVTLSESANIVYINGSEQLLAFHDKWSRPTPMSSVIGPDRGSHYWDPDWVEVSRAGYDGIIIAPYIYCMRTEGPFWYYGWDCASGCIWNLDAIESFTFVESRKELIVD